MPKMKTKSLRVPVINAILIENFKRECRKARLPMTKAVTLLIRRVVKGEIKLIDVDDLL